MSSSAHPVTPIAPCTPAAFCTGVSTCPKAGDGTPVVNVQNDAAAPSAYVVPVTFDARTCHEYDVLADSPVSATLVVLPADVQLVLHVPLLLVSRQYW